jgi:hypothetical protein
MVKGPVAAVRATIAGRELEWPGRVARAMGKLDAMTRMINVAVQVDKPYDKKPPLAAGLFVDVEIAGRPLPDAAVIPRSALHTGDIVWVATPEGRLEFRKVEIARLTTSGAVISSGLNDGDQVVITAVKGVVNGMQVRSVVVNGGGKK